MQDYTGWFRSVMELVEMDVDDALALIRASAVPGAAVIRLAEGDLDAEEALSYARLLLELGQPDMAEGLVHDVIAAQCRIDQAVA